MIGVRAQLFMGVLRGRCHVAIGGVMRLADPVRPCGGNNACGGARDYIAGTGAHVRSLIANSSSTFSYANLEDECTTHDGPLTDGDVYCCVPPAPPDGAAYYFNAASDALPELRTHNPDYGFTSFDNVLWAWLVVYRAITIEDWAITLQMLIDGLDPTWGVRRPPPLNSHTPTRTRQLAHAPPPSPIAVRLVTARAHLCH